MELKQAKVVEYRHGDEDAVLHLLYSSTEPIVFRMPEFPITFDLDFFINSRKGETSYTRYHNRKPVASSTASLGEVLGWIKEDQPVRIFGQSYSDKLNSQLVESIPLWQHIPFRPRYFRPSLGKALFFFGGKGASTGIHYDRELNSNLHVCLHGRKRVLLFGYHDSRKIYKTPFKSDSLINFSAPLQRLREDYPELNKATAYDVILEPGDMLYMPKRWWHFIEYLEHNASATYSFYPRVIDQLLGALSGAFYLGFSKEGLSIDKSSAFRAFAARYVRATGWRRWFMRGMELTATALLYPVCTLTAVVNFVVLKKRPY